MEELKDSGKGNDYVIIMGDWECCISKMGMRFVSMDKETEMEGLTGDGRTGCGIFGEEIVC